MARNGYLAEDGIRLVTVEDDDQLIATAAASFVTMRAAAARDGVALKIVEPAGAYRSAWVQADMVDHPERWNLNPDSVIGFSRYGQSHGWGNRFDANSAAVPWLLKHAADYGWTREYGARDPNHFKHDGVTAIGGGGGGATAPQHRTDDAMYCIGLDAGKPTAVSFSIGSGVLQRHSQGRQQELAAAQAQQTGGCYWYDDDDFARTMWNHGLGEFTVAHARSLVGNGRLVASWLKPGQTGSASMSDADRAAIIEGVIAGIPKFPTKVILPEGTLS